MIHGGIMCFRMGVCKMLWEHRRKSLLVLVGREEDWRIKTSWKGWVLRSIENAGWYKQKK